MQTPVDGFIGGEYFCEEIFHVEEIFQVGVRFGGNELRIPRIYELRIRRIYEWAKCECLKQISSIRSFVIRIFVLIRNSFPFANA